jgi:hypothetical protein
MGAYMIEFSRPMCARSGCFKFATHYVHNTLNERVGAYCSGHAKKRVAELNDPKVLAAHTGAIQAER